MADVNGVTQTASAHICLHRLYKVIHECDFNEKDEKKLQQILQIKKKKN